MSRKVLVSFLFLVVGLSGGTVSGQSQPDGQLTIAFDASIATSFLDPAETPGIGTPFVFLQNWNEFLFALTFITEGKMRTLPTGIYALLSSEFYGNYPILAASLVLFSVPVLVLYFVFQREFVEGLTAGALKH